MSAQLCRPRVLHLIPSLESGGAQEVLFTLIANTVLDFEHQVIVFDALNDVYSERFLAIGVACSTLQRKRFKFLLGFMVLLGAVHGGDLNHLTVHGWLYRGNFFALLLKCFRPDVKVVLSIHNGTDAICKAPLRTAVLSRLCALLSRVLRTVTVFVSERCRQAHSVYSGSIVIPNMLRFADYGSPGSLQRLVVKGRTFEKRSLVLLHVGRDDPVKDHAFLLEMVGCLKDKGLRFTLMLAGQSIDEQNERVNALIQKFDVDDVCILLGQVNNMADLYKYADLTLLVSDFESFSNVLLESIACGTPFVSTDVGIAGDILVAGSAVFEKKTPDDFATALMSHLVRSEFLCNREAAYEDYVRVASRFSIDSVVKQYFQVWSR